MFDLNLIKPFLAVYEQGSITKASEILGLTQPATSLAIKRLEESLGRQLFIRHGGRIEPTADAHEVAISFKRIQWHTQRVMANERDFKVSVNDGLMIRIPTLSGVQLIESSSDEYNTLDALREGKVDMAVDFISTSDPSFLCEKIKEDRVLLACRSDHPVIGDEITLEQYEQLEHVSLHLRRQNTTALEYLSGLRLNRQIVKSVSSTSNLLLSIVDTNAVCGCLESMVPLAMKLGLKVIELPFATRPLEYHLIYHIKNEPSQRHIKIREHIKAIVGAL